MSDDMPSQEVRQFKRVPWGAHHCIAVTRFELAEAFGVSFGDIDTQHSLSHLDTFGLHTIKVKGEDKEVWVVEHAPEQENPFQNTSVHRKINYEICTAIDLLKVGIVLEKMVELGILSKQQANLYDKQAHVLLDMIANENNKAFGVQPK